MRRVMLVGATGLIGRHVLARLLQDPRIDAVQVLARSPAPQAAATLHWHQAPLEQWHRQVDAWQVDAVICCLGTTRRQAGSREGLARVDRDAVLAVARQAQQARVPHFLAVSALNAAVSSWFHYSRIKGQVEAELEACGFPRLTLAQPSLLLGQRQQARPGEDLAAWLYHRAGSWLGDRQPDWRPIPAAVVADALWQSLFVAGAAVERLRYRDLVARAAIPA